jgi:mannose-6-phosphate isomerase-like protein (cupin superfamily)
MLRDRMKTEQPCHNGRGAVMSYRPYHRSKESAQVDFIDLVMVPPGSSIGLHRHGNNEEWYIILSGEGDMWIDGRTVRVKTGDIQINRQFGEHGLTNISHTDIHLLVFQTSKSSPLNHEGS